MSNLSAERIHKRTYVYSQIILLIENVNTKHRNVYAWRLVIEYNRSKYFDHFRILGLTPLK